MPDTITAEIHLVNEIPEQITQIINNVVTKIRTKNNLEKECYQIKILISANPQLNAITKTNTSPPLLILPMGLLKNVHNEDELAGIIALELGYIGLNEIEKDVDRGGVDRESSELIVDPLAIDLLTKANYDPNALNHFLHRVNSPNSPNDLRFMLTDEADKMLNDPKDMSALRIRRIETYIASLALEGKIPQSREKIQLPIEWNIFCNSEHQTSNYSLLYDKDDAATECDYLNDLEEKNKDLIITDENGNLINLLDEQILSGITLQFINDHVKKIAKKLGESDYSRKTANDANPNSFYLSYLDDTKLIVDEIAKNTKGIIRRELLKEFANQIMSQKELSYYIRDVLERYEIQEILSKPLTNSVLGILINQCDKDENLRVHIVRFLTGPIEEKSDVAAYINTHYKHLFNMNLLTEYQLNFNDPNKLCEKLTDSYNTFHSLSIEQQIAVLEPLLFAPHFTDVEQENKITELLEDFMPEHSSAEEKNIMLSIIKSYLEQIDSKERRLLITVAVLGANKSKTKQNEYKPERATGNMLNNTLSRMGPAGAKLLQVMHSHPTIPKEIRKILEDSKTNNRKLARWEVMELIEKNGLFDANNTNHHNPVTCVGKISGSGSFGITVFNTLKDSSTVADWLLYLNATTQAEREFSLMSATIEKVAPLHQVLKPISSLIKEAQQSAKAEINMSLVPKQNRLAEHAYDQFTIQVGKDTFTHKVAKYIAHGDGFKRFEIVEGKHFNDLPEGPHKKSIAKAMLITQLTLRLAGVNTDLDRHGGNIKVNENTIFHFDFGAINRTKISNTDKEMTGKLLGKAAIAAISGKDFGTELVMQIKKAELSEQTKHYLSGFVKDFIALRDYINEFESTPDTLKALVIFCLSASTVDKSVKKGFNSVIPIIMPVGLRIMKHCYRVNDITITSSIPNPLAPDTIIQDFSSEVIINTKNKPLQKGTNVEREAKHRTKVYTPQQQVHDDSNTITIKKHPYKSIFFHTGKKNTNASKMSTMSP